MRASILAQYRNGDFDVTIMRDWTKIVAGEGLAEFPENIDVKITDYCDAGCAYCHENSTVQWRHGDIMSYVPLFDQLPAWCELAIGGGNPLSHPDLTRFAALVKSHGLVPNLTVNGRHVSAMPYEVYDNFYGIGISYVPGIYGLGWALSSHRSGAKPVAHLINGIHSWSLVRLLLRRWIHVLILGYKTWWRGANYVNPYVERRMEENYSHIGDCLWQGKLSFDNLAIAQLKPQRFYDEATFATRYMGDDGSHTMYMDLVKGEYALNSFSPVRYPIGGTIREMFANLRNTSAPVIPHD